MAVTTTTVAWEHPLPQSLPEGMSWLWKRVLFPGESPKEGQVSLWTVLFLIFVPGWLLYGNLSFHLLEPDESRYAEIPREMLDRDDWVVPHLQGQPYLDKPPLMYWLVMLSYRMFGVDAWSARLVPALALHATILLTYLLGRRHLGGRGATWGAIFLSVAPGFIEMGRLLILDGLLTMWTTTATLTAFEAIRHGRLRRSWWRISWIAAGLGVLTKGPVVLILVLVPTWFYDRILHRARSTTWGCYVEYLVGSVMISLPWYAAIGLREPIFLKYFLWEHNIVRFVAPFDHIRPVWFYLPIVWAGLLPASWFVLALVWSFFRHPIDGTVNRPAEMGFYLFAGCWVVVFFSLSGSKLPTYVLPSFPLLAMAFGWFVSQSKPWLRHLAAGLVVTTILLLLYFNHSFLPWYARMRSPMGQTEKVVSYCADPKQPVLCFPRSCDSVAFYLKRDDLRNIRSKNFPDLVEALRRHPRTVLLCTHRHSFESIRNALPADLRIVEHVSYRRELDREAWYDKLTTETPWGLCDLLVIEKVR
ncbi:MAG: glycosyltransferase family 39 protein [Gemmataceae bacterium]|nr:glycosyltransferase family 39 protein [Gemmataceae bacterium]